MIVLLLIVFFQPLDLFLNNLHNRGYIKYLEDAESSENCQVTRNADTEIERLVAFIKKQMVAR